MTSLTLVRRIKASPAIVFDAFSTAEGLTNWWGPDDFPVISADADVRVGGAFCVRFRSDNGLEHECAGQFLDIVRPVRIVMSWRWTFNGETLEKDNVSRVELHLRPIELGTELTLVHAALSAPDAFHSHDSGWRRALVKLQRNFDPTREATHAQLS
jgi:uncharacterized protein YndB with AHSA1/START domain